MDWGIPIDTADCYYGKNDTLLVLQSNIPSELCWNVGCIPCWSAGRLVLIYEVCTGLKFTRTEEIKSEIEDVLYQIQFRIENTDCEFNLSKLQ